jgi:hypothetical protein
MMTVQCCQCKKVRLQNYWDIPRKPVEGTVSHTYCPVCLALAKDSIRMERQYLATAGAK